jgi:hypothetical protein
MVERHEEGGVKIVVKGPALIGVRVDMLAIMNVQVKLMHKRSAGDSKNVTPA